MSAGTKRILTEATGIKLLRALEIINDGSATTSAATTADESRILTDATGDALVDELDDLLTTLKGNLGSTRNGVAVTVEGNKASVNVTSGQYVIVQNSTISGITDGAYKATANVTAGTAFTSGNLTAVSGGVANSLNDQIVTYHHMNYLGVFSDIASLKTALTSFAAELSPPETRLVYFNTNVPQEYWAQWELHSGFVQKPDASIWSAVFTTPIGETLSIGVSGSYYSSQQEKSNISVLDSSVIEFYGLTLGQAKSITPKPYKRIGIGFGIFSYNVDSKKIIPNFIEIPSNASTLTISSLMRYDVGEVTTGSYDLMIVTWKAE